MIRRLGGGWAVVYCGGGRGSYGVELSVELASRRVGAGEWGDGLQPERPIGRGRELPSA